MFYSALGHCECVYLCVYGIYLYIAAKDVQHFGSIVFGHLLSIFEGGHTQQVWIERDRYRSQISYV